MSTKVTIPKARLSFPSLFSKSSFEGKEGKFEATFLFPKSDTKTYDKIIAAIEQCKSDAKIKVAASKLCIQDGDEIYDEKEYDGYQGMWAVKAANSKRPTLLTGQKEPIVEEDDILYAGCYVNAIIDPWAQDNQWGKRINANLLGVQFVKDGEPFGDAVTASADDFDEVEEDEEL